MDAREKTKCTFVHKLKSVLNKSWEEIMAKVWRSGITSLFFVAAALITTGCNVSGGSNYGPRTSSVVSASLFVNALNNIDSQASNSYVARNQWNTERSYMPGQDDWFVIWDAKHREYKAVSLQYIRSIVYYDYYSNSRTLAREFRNIEDRDLSSGYWNGDPWGNDYEVVDYDFYTDLYFGRNSGYAYEDEEDMFDVSLMQSEVEQRQFFEKASAISYQYSLSIEASMSLISLGQKVQSMMHQSGGITLADQDALLSDIEHLSGVTLQEMMAATQDSNDREDVISRVAEQIGTTASSLEQQILPEIFGLEL